MRLFCFTKSYSALRGTDKTCNVSTVLSSQFRRNQLILNHFFPSTYVGVAIHNVSQADSPCITIEYGNKGAEMGMNSCFVPLPKAIRNRGWIIYLKRHLKTGILKSNIASTFYFTLKHRNIHSPIFWQRAKVIFIITDRRNSNRRCFSSTNP